MGSNKDEQHHGKARSSIIASNIIIPSLILVLLLFFGYNHFIVLKIETLKPLIQFIVTPVSGFIVLTWFFYGHNRKRFDNEGGDTSSGIKGYCASHHNTLFFSSVLFLTIPFTQQFYFIFFFEVVI